MKRIFISLLTAFATIRSSGANVVWGTVSFEYIQDFWGQNFEIKTHGFGDMPSGISTARVYGVCDAGKTRATLTPSEIVVLDPEHAWRIFNKGDLISLDTMAGGDLDYFYKYVDSPTGGGVSDAPLAIPRGQSGTQILGFVVYDEKYIENESIRFAEIFGWVELGYDGTSVYVVDSAIDTSGRGIYAGTGIAVPEPAASALVLTGFALLLRRRRRAVAG